MLLKSNLGQVIAQLKRLEAEMPLAIERAIGPKHWKGRLELAAAKTLKAQWATERNLQLREFYERMTPKIVASIMAEAFSGSTVYSLAIPSETVEPTPDLSAAAQFNLGQRTPSGRTRKAVVDQAVFGQEAKPAEMAQYQNLARARQIILDWVTLEKDLGPQDYRADGTPFSPEELAERIGIIMGVGFGVKPRERTPAMDDAAQRLGQAIQRWLDGEGENSPPPSYNSPGQPPWQVGGMLPQKPGQLTFKPDVARQWLWAVLLAWRSLLLAGLPGRLEWELHKLFEKTKQEML